MSSDLHVVNSTPVTRKKRIRRADLQLSDYLLAAMPFDGVRWRCQTFLRFPDVLVCPRVANQFDLHSTRKTFGKPTRRTCATTIHVNSALLVKIAYDTILQEERALHAKGESAVSAHLFRFGVSFEEHFTRRAGEYAEVRERRRRAANGAPLRGSCRPGKHRSLFQLSW